MPGPKDYDQSYETLVKTLTGPDRLRLGAILFRGINAKDVAAPWNESRWFVTRSNQDVAEEKRWCFEEMSSETHGIHVWYIFNYVKTLKSIKCR